jgi:hypothetical protein
MTRRAGALKARYDRVGQPAEFAAELRIAMKTAKVTQAALAQAFDTVQPTVSKWVTGEIIPDPPTVFFIERYLDLPPGRLSRHLGYEPTSTTLTRVR